MGILTKQSPFSEEFEFFGECHFMFQGVGSVSIERKMGKEWSVLTDDQGNPMTFVGEGVLFNSKISSRARIKHRVSADTASEIQFEIVKER